MRSEFAATTALATSAPGSSGDVESVASPALVSTGFMGHCAADWLDSSALKKICVNLNSRMGFGKDELTYV